jgi:hypothetical protein
MSSQKEQKLLELARLGQIRLGSSLNETPRGLPTGVSDLDQALPWGGLPANHLTAFIGPAGSGRLRLWTSALSLLHRHSDSHNLTNSHTSANSHTSTNSHASKNSYTPKHPSQQTVPWASWIETSSNTCMSQPLSRSFPLASHAAQANAAQANAVQTHTAQTHAAQANTVQAHANQAHANQAHANQANAAQTNATQTHAPALYPPALAQMGIELQRLLLIRAPGNRKTWSIRQLFETRLFQLIGCDDCSSISPADLQKLAQECRDSSCATVLFFEKPVPETLQWLFKLRISFNHPDFYAVEKAQISLSNPLMIRRSWGLFEKSLSAAP